ncbi:MAG TPA: hypothetical protein VHV74_25165, partial [Pseudonocardiaceae bacterium]|nr:hypothetical protein [Pseudonocardiaceae bacterium]
SAAALASQLTGPDTHGRLVDALVALPGVRVLERDGRDVLLSVLPTPTSIGRGFGIFLMASDTGDGVVLRAQNRLPLPAANLSSTLRYIERAARMSARPQHV